MPKKIVIIGGGICGLACAHRLLKSNLNVTLLEASDQLGGLGTFFQYEDAWIDRFYHCVMPNDKHLLKLMAEVGLAERIYWEPTQMGFIVAGKHYAFNTPVDLLRFTAIPLAHRIRLGVMSLLLRKLGEGKDLDNLPTQDFLTKIFGKRIWENFWQPLFKSKFGPHAGSLPSLYLWQRLGREKNVATRGYLTGGLKRFIDEMEKSILRRGGKIIKNHPVAAFHETSTGVILTCADGSEIAADWVICTAPMPLVRELIRNSSFEGKYKDAELQAQGVVNALFFLKRPLENHYWTPVVNSGTGFDGVVEMSALVDKRQYAGHHLAYVMKYCDRNSTFFKMNDRDIIQQWTKDFLMLYRDLPLTKQDIVDVRLFKAPFVEPVYPLGYLEKKPGFQVGDSHLLLANTSQVYPDITSWNASSRLACEVVDFLRMKLLAGQPCEPRNESHAVKLDQ